MVNRAKLFIELQFKTYIWNTYSLLSITMYW
jgi:hypothetical protein